MTRRNPLLVLAAGLACLLLACSGDESPVSSTDVATTVRSWGGMRDVMREGHTQGRAVVTDVARPGSYGVGALANLTGEVTIDDGVAHVSELKDGKLVVRPATRADQATLLVVAQVSAWDLHELPAVSDLDALEEAILTKVRAAGFDPSTTPIPVRVKARFKKIDVHVVNGSCPHAHPEGPAPWRLTGGTAAGVLVGIFIEGQAGVLTHHGRRTHLHAILRTADGHAVAGHLDAVSIEAGGQLQIPRFAPKSLPQPK